MRLLAILLLFCATAHAKDWFIRDDGGDYYQCNGQSDTPYTGVKKKLSSYQRKVFKVKDAAACALSNPMFLMKPGNTTAWRDDYVGGDTVWFKRDAQGGNGVYDIGLKNTKTGKGVIDADYYQFYFCKGNPSGCVMPALPSGTQAQPTRWLGPCYPNCSNANGTNVQDAAKLVGVNGIFRMFDLHGADWFEVSGFEFTQYTQCTLAEGPGKCVQNQDDYASHAIELEYLTAQGPSNGTLRHIAIHGISGQALLGSHLNKAETDKMVFDHLYVRGDGLSGFDSDGGGCNTSCEDTGRIELTNSYFDFVGCVTPYNVTFDPNTGLPSSVNYCKAQQTGGYGDAVVFIAMANAHVYMSHVRARYNAQDGFDLLHMGDDGKWHPILELYNNEANGNMGQTYKIGGGSSDTYFINNFANSNCKVMTQGTAAVFSGFPAGWNQYIQARGDYCRAADGIVAFFTDNRKTIIIHNVVTGYASPFYDLLCTAPCTGKEIAIYQDNIMMGYPNPEPDDGRQPAGFYFNGLADPFHNPGSAISHNVAYKMRNDTCQQVTAETDYVCTDPQLASESNVDTFDPRMVSTGSPAYATGITAGLPTDYFDRPWLTPPSRGLSELTTAPPPGYQLANNYEVQVKVTYTDASNQPTTVRQIQWSASDPAILTATPASDPSLCLITPIAGKTGAVQVIAKGFTDATHFVTATFDVNIMPADAAPAVKGTIAPTGPATPIPPGRR